MGDLSFKKPNLKPGNPLWLAFNQMRRELRSRKNNNGAKAIIGNLSILLILILGCYGMGRILYGFYNHGVPLEYGFYYAAGKKLLNVYIGLFFMSLMTSFLYFTDRGDLDLLLSSPIPPKNIATARLLVSSVRTVFLFVMFGCLFIGYTAVMGHPELFSFLPVALGLALLEAGLTFLLARYVLLWLGLVNGRRLAQFIGIGGILGGMLYLQSGTRDAKNFTEMFKYNGNHNAIDNFVVFMGQSLLGNWLGALIIFVFGLISFIIIMNNVGRNFGADASYLAGQSITENKKSDKNKSIKFAKSSIFILMKKEILAVIREPITIVQVVIPLAAIIPALVTIFNNDKISDDIFAFVVPPLIVFITASITSAMAWMVASVEEARDLLKSSPTGMGRVYISKAITALLPAILELIIFSFFFIKLGWGYFAILLLFAILANVSMIMIEFANIRPAKRPKMMQKPDRSIISIIFSMIIMLVWAVAAGVAGYSLLLAIIPSVVAIAFTVWSVWGNKDGHENYIRSAAATVWAQKTTDAKLAAD